MNSYSKNTSGVSSLQDGMGQLSVTDKEKANTFNTFFSSVFTQDNFHTVTGDESDGITLADIRVTPDVIYDKLCKLNKRKAQGPDSIPPRVLIELSKALSIPLSILFNKSLEDGKIPNEWKSANVIAIFKKGTISIPGNYRPVSLTCVCCKLL